jgi:integrase
MSVEDLHAIASFCFRPTATIVDWHIGTLLILSFALYLRVGEVCALTRDQVTIDATSVRALIPRSKADQCGKGALALAARSGSILCPARVLEEWLSRAPPSTFLFPSFSGLPRAMSTDCVRNELRRVSRAANLAHDLTPHSTRGGAASTALACGVPQAAVKMAGRWSSDSAFAAYAEISLDTLQGAGNLL